MNAKVYIAIVAGAVLLTASMAPAESYFIRNRPFTQVIKVGSEPYVPLDGLLRALGYNWDMQDGKVVVTKSGGKNPTPSSPKVVINYGGQDLALEGTAKGDTVYVPLRPVSKFLNYVVNTNKASGITDVVQGRLVTDTDKKAAEEVAKAAEEREKAQKEAWDKKAASIKEAREAKEAAKEAEASASPSASPSESPTETASTDTKESKSKSKSKEKDKEKVAEAAPSPSPTADTKDKEPEVPKVQRIEVYDSSATPEQANGLVKIAITVRNQGDAAAPNVQGTYTLTEPSTVPGKPGRVLVNRKSFRGPALATDKSWTYEESYKHNLGTSMPNGTYKLDITVWNPPPPAKPAK